MNNEQLNNEKLNDENLNDELARLYEESICELKEGEIIKGTIVHIGEKDILVDIGYKSEGMIYKSELTDPEDLKIGDNIDVVLESKENDMGMVVLSHEKAKRQQGWVNILNNYKEGDTISGKVGKKVRGGFMVDVGMEAFLPASISAMQDVGGADNLVGNKYEFRIVKINIPRKNIVLSRKDIIEEKKQEEKRVILDTIKKGDIVKGVVRNITDFGAFVDIGGGITGLLHITDLSWGRVSHPSNIVNVGDEVDVKILDFDKENVKVSLGLKQKEPSPWENVSEKYPEGSVVKGRVVNIMPYGIFVELEKGVEGLIHISEFSWSQKFNHPSERFQMGDEVEAMVLRADSDNQKLSLGIKQLEKDPWEGVEERFKVGEKISGEISAILDYGAFVKLESGIEGLIHVSDLSWTKRVNHPKDVLTKGDKVEAVILSVDEQNRRIALGIKQLTPDPWDEIAQKYSAGTESDGKVTNITNFGIFVELEKDLEGLLHVSEINLAPGQKMEDVFNVGQEIKVKVIHIDSVQKKIALSAMDDGGDKKPAENAEPAEKPRENDVEEASEPHDPAGSEQPDPVKDGNIDGGASVEENKEK